MTCGIYCITNKINNKKYVGQSVDIERRTLDHWRSLSKGKDNCTILQYAYNKYGKDSFDVEILLECLPNELDDFERLFINLLNSTDRKFGYNLSFGGSNGIAGHKRSEETRKRMSVANTKERHPMWGKHHSPETIQGYKEARAGERAYQFGTKKESSKSKYFGVYCVPRKGHIYWSAYIKMRGSRVYIGCSKDEKVVARMYDKFIVENGLPNPLNFPEEWNH